MKYPLGNSVDYGEVSVKTDVDLSQFSDLEVVVALETARELRERVILSVGVGGSIIAAPVLHRGVLYFGCADKNFYAVSTKGEELWRYGTEAQIFATARISEDIIYFGSYDGNFYALDLKGKLKWRFSTQDKIISIASIHNNKVYFGSCDGNFYSLDAKTGHEIWRLPTGGSVTSSAIYRGGRVYFGSDDKNYYSVDAENGRLLWKFPTHGMVSCQPSFLRPIYKNIIYFSSYDFNVYAVTFEGNFVWKLNTGDHTYAVTVYCDQIYFGSRDGNLYCLDAQTGRELWRFTTEGYVTTQPLIYNGRIYFGSGDRNLYCITLQGKLLWKFPTGGVVASSPIADKKTVYFGPWDCNLYAVSHEGRLLWKFPTSLSYQSLIDLESPEAREVAHQVIWSRETPRDRYGKALPEGRADYGDGLDTYQSIGMHTSYMADPEKAYKSKRKYG